MNLKKQLRHYLTHCGITAAELARRASVPKQSISDWLAGVPPRSIPNVRRVAEVFGTSIDELCFGDAQAAGVAPGVQCGSPVEEKL